MHRYDFVFLFDVTDGNPNGDPDAGNLPRIDPETGEGLVTDVCLKRKIRNYVGLVHGETPPHEIYVKEKAVLNAQHERAYQECDLKPVKGKLPKKEEDAARLKAWMCGNFFDIRTFGAVMSTGVNCGQVRGPVQFTFARSVDPVVTLEHAVTRCAVTTEKEADKQSGDNRTMGRKFTLPYGLYRPTALSTRTSRSRRASAKRTSSCCGRAWSRCSSTTGPPPRGQMAARKPRSSSSTTAPLGNAPAHTSCSPGSKPPASSGRRSRDAPAAVRGLRTADHRRRPPTCRAGITVVYPFGDEESRSNERPPKPRQRRAGRSAGRGAQICRLPLRTDAGVVPANTGSRRRPGASHVLRPILRGRLDVPGQGAAPRLQDGQAPHPADQTVRVAARSLWRN